METILRFFVLVAVRLSLSALQYKVLQFSYKKTGDADGLGEIRKKELEASALKLGLRSGADVLVLEDEKFPDSMTSTWSAEEIAKILSKAFSPGEGKSSRRSKGGSGFTDEPTATVDVLITFDKKGVSSHPNHISLYHGARAWLSTLMTGKAGWKCPVAMYTLSSTNVLRKYLSFLDSPATIMISGFRGAGMSRKKRSDEPPGFVFVSGLNDYRKGRDAMVNGHRSQMRWFRWGWIAISRYMIVNDLKRDPM